MNKEPANIFEWMKRLGFRVIEPIEETIELQLSHITWYNEKEDLFFNSVALTYDLERNYQYSYEEMKDIIIHILRKKKLERILK